MEAYIFINSDPGTSLKISEAALGSEEVKMVHSVTGQFDVVAYVEAIGIDVLIRIINKFQSLEGVRRTQTAVARQHKRK